MYPKFIEVHGKDNAPILVNVENMVAFENGAIALQEIGILKTIDTYDDIKALITDCGCLIHKADPRLDLTHPLTLDDLQSMIGEPVWNSNLDRWELVKHVTDITVTTCHTGQYCSQYDDDDLIKTPLYRMHQ